MGVYDSIMKGLNEAVEYEKGNLPARSSKLSVEPLPDFHAAEIKKIRVGLGMTQSFFAGFMGVSQKTVEAWESGRNAPDGPARRILSMVLKDPKLPERYEIICK